GGARLGTAVVGIHLLHLRESLEDLLIHPVGGGGALFGADHRPLEPVRRAADTEYIGTDGHQRQEDRQTDYEKRYPFKPLHAVKPRLDSSKPTFSPLRARHPRRRPITDRSSQRQFPRRAQRKICYRRPGPSAGRKKLVR